MRIKNKIGSIEDYIKANRKASREEELERNGGRWVAKDRPHKNKKAYNRKEGKRINFDYPLFMFNKLYYLFSKAVTLDVKLSINVCKASI